LRAPLAPLKARLVWTNGSGLVLTRDLTRDDLALCWSSVVVAVDAFNDTHLPGLVSISKVEEELLCVLVYFVTVALVSDYCVVRLDQGLRDF
jgi:hypothetical protein